MVESENKVQTIVRQEGVRATSSKVPILRFVSWGKKSFLYNYATLIYTSDRESIEREYYRTLTAFMDLMMINPDVFHREGDAIVVKGVIETEDGIVVCYVKFYYMGEKKGTVDVITQYERDFWILSDQRRRYQLAEDIPFIDIFYIGVE